ncbi:hypothetical protein H6G50_01265 [Oscillatoria sp. FACHB-1406]|nr:hypothetical protein [Oscillatoria sp. FACHB-1406]
MLVAKHNHFPNLRFGLLLVIACSLGLTTPVSAQYRTRVIEEGEQPPTDNMVPAATPAPDAPFVLPTPESIPAPPPSDPNNLRSLSQSNNLLSLQGGQRLMEDASSAIGSQNYSLAVQKLQEARQVYNQLSGLYGQLADTFSGIDNRISETQRTNALNTAEMRDRATYQLALVHRAQNRPELAVPLLIQIIKSQNPTTDLGKKAFQQLYELGFVDSPFPRPRAVAP